MATKKINRYEKEQIVSVINWENEEPGLYTKGQYAIEKMTGLLFDVISENIPKKINKVLQGKNRKRIEGAINKGLTAALEKADYAAEYMAWEEIVKKNTKTGDISELRNRNLKISDKLAHKVHVRFNQSLFVEGGLTGWFGLPGAIVDIPAFIVAQRMEIYMIGLCYGYKSTDPEMKAIQLQILNIMGCGDLVSKRAELSMIDKMFDILKTKKWEEIIKIAEKDSKSIEALLCGVKDSIEKLVNIVLKKEVKLSESFMEKKIVPIISAGIGATLNIIAFDELGWTARRIFQKKWLMDNDKWIDDYNQLSKEGIFIETTGGRYYLSEGILKEK